jgi:hypothetical protein
MSEQGWDDGIDAPPQKRGVPGWLWFCGGGCLLVIVIGIGLLVWGKKLYDEGRDSEQQWPRLAQVLPFDERPPDLSLQMYLPIPVPFYTLKHEDGYVLLVFDLDPSEAKDFGQVFTPDFEGGGSVFGFGGVKNPELSQVDVQGRELTVQRFYQEGRDQGEDADAESTGQSAFVDVTPPDHVGMVAVQIIRVEPGEGPLTDDEIRDVLSGFHIGPDYVPPPPPSPEEPAAEESPAEEGGGAEDDGQ